MLLTVIRGAVVSGAVNPGQTQEGNGGLRTALIDAVTLGQDIDAIEVVVYGGRGLVDGADYGASFVGHFPQQPDALGRRHLVQSAGRFVQKEYVRVVDQFQSNRQSLPFPATQFLRGNIAPVVEMKILEDVCDDFGLFVAMFELEIGGQVHQLLDGEEGLVVIVLRYIAGIVPLDLDASSNPFSPGIGMSYIDFINI